MSNTLEVAMKKEYYDTSNGFSETKIYEKLKPSFPTLTHKLLKAFITQQLSNQLFVKKKSTSDYNLVIPKVPFSRCQMDLLDLSSEVVNRNHGMKWLFVLIDSYTKLAFVRPMKTKAVEPCLNAFKEINDEIWDDYHELILIVDCDNEKSFTSGEFTRYCEKNDIKLHFSRKDDSRSKAFVERFNRTLREKINKTKIALNTNNWTDHIQSLVKAYNKTRHSATGRKPVDAVIENSLLEHKIDRNQSRTSRVKMRIGDEVRVLLHRENFEKGTAQKWSKGLHKIERIEIGNRYYVSDRENYYKDYELQPVSKIEERPEEDSEVDEKVEVEAKENKRSRKIGRRLNKESVVPANEVKDVNARVLRKYRIAPRDMGFMIRT